MNPNISRYLYMPMEIASRELDSRLLIALYATAAGIDVVTGQKWLLQENARWMPKGYWIFKTLTPGDAKAMGRVQKLGHRIAAIDEEMPGLGRDYGRLRWVHPDSMAACETVFCLGSQHEAALIKEYSDQAGKLVITGNPRWDFLRPELRSLYSNDANAIRQKYGNFILVNTNIGLVNSAKNTAEALIRSLTRDGRINLDLPADRAFVDDLVAFETSNLAATPPLIRRLRQTFPDYPIVLRPHPTEKLEPYEAALADIDGVHIVREGPAAGWLTACKLLIHTSCTTAAEAFALGKPTVCYQTIPSQFHTYFLSGALSAIGESEDGVVECVRSILAGESDPSTKAKKQALFEEFFAAQSGPFAAERIASHIASKAAQEMGQAPRWKPKWFFRRKWRPSKFQARIFPDMSAEVIQTRLGQLASAAGMQTVPKVVKVGDGQYHIFNAPSEND
ncbi:MAG: surface carbohydrate biosynthesis protein [Alphaproteobacteria bacterium]